MSHVIKKHKFTTDKLDLLAQVVFYKRIKEMFILPCSLLQIYLFYMNFLQNSIFHQVRMAERSKAPDSRYTFLTDSERAFWSSYEGVGSNPTSDKFFSLQIIFFIFAHVFDNVIKIFNVSFLMSIFF